jgi:Transposase domain (DUF772)
VEGRPAYAPEMLVSVWLYAYALSVTSSRRLEQRIRGDLAFGYWAGGATPDHWTLNAFRRGHAKGLNDVFTPVLELARASGLGRLGHVAIDSTRMAAGGCVIALCIRRTGRCGGNCAIRPAARFMPVAKRWSNRSTECCRNNGACGGFG